MNYSKELEKALTSGKTTGEIVKAIKRIVAKHQEERELKAKRKLAKCVHDGCAELKAYIVSMTEHSLDNTCIKDI